MFRRLIRGQKHVSSQAVPARSGRVCTFENLESRTLLSHGSISGYVYFDTNTDGQIEIGEPGTDNVVVKLQRYKDGNPVGPCLRVHTNTKGYFSFGSLAPGVFTLTEVVPRNEYPTYAGYAGFSVQVNPGDVITDADFGNFGVVTSQRPTSGVTFT